MFFEMNMTIHVVLPKSDTSRPVGFDTEVESMIKRFNRMMPGFKFVVHNGQTAYLKDLSQQMFLTGFKPEEYEHYSHLENLEPVTGPIQAPSGIRV